MAMFNSFLHVYQGVSQWRIREVSGSPEGALDSQFQVKPQCGFGDSNDYNVMIITICIIYPYAPCMEYLPTFALKITQM